MAFLVEISKQAELEMAIILDWLLQQQAGENGIRWFLGLETAIASLDHHPQRCFMAPESHIFSFEVRQLLYGHKPHLYRILFTIKDNTVHVLHVRHGRRSPIEPSH